MTDNEPSKPLRVLLVDDEELVRDLLADMLTAEGFLVEAAPSGEVALQLARAEPPDLVLSDVNMPGMDGVELLSQFGEDADLDAVPFFLMSGNPDEEARGLQAGAVHFFHKPIADGALLVRAFEATRPSAAGDPVNSLHRHLGEALTCLTEAASEGTAPPALQAALVSVLAEVARLHGITEWIQDGLADLSSDSHPRLPDQTAPE